MYRPFWFPALPLPGSGPQQIRLALSMIIKDKETKDRVLDENDRSENVPAEIETALLAVWRRVLTEGSGPELTLPEAAALLGTSVESVRRRIKAGQIRAFRDERGRVRIVATVAPPAGAQTLEDEAGFEAESLAQLWQELKATRNQLETTEAEKETLHVRLNQLYNRSEDMRQELSLTRSEAQVLQDELDNTREALEHTQDELASLWRVMSSRSERLERAASYTLTDGNEAFDLGHSRSGLSEERIRIQGQISRVRDLSRRRRWPWPQAS